MLLALAAGLVVLLDPNFASVSGRIVVGIWTLATLLGFSRAGFALAIAVLGTTFFQVVWAPGRPGQEWVGALSTLLSFAVWFAPSARATEAATDEHRNRLGLVIGGVLLATATLYVGQGFPVTLAAGAAAATFVAWQLNARRWVIRVALAIAAVGLAALAARQYRNPGYFFAAYVRNRPSLTSFYVPPIRRPAEEGLLKDYLFLRGFGGEYFLSAPRAWVADGGSRFYNPAVLALRFASRWIEIVDPRATLDFSGIVTGDLCDHILPLKASIRLYQPGRLLEFPRCGRVLEDDETLAQSPHLMIFPPESEPVDLKYRPPVKAGQSWSRWYCRYDAYNGPKDGATDVPWIEEGFAHPDPARPALTPPALVHRMTFRHIECKVVADPGFFANPALRADPVIARQLALETSP